MLKKMQVNVLNIYVISLILINQIVKENLALPTNIKKAIALIIDNFSNAII